MAASKAAIKVLDLLADQHGRDLQEARKMLSAGTCTSGEVKAIDRLYCAAIAAALDARKQPVL